MNTTQKIEGATAGDFFLWLGALAAFYGSVIAFTFLVFDYIDTRLPNLIYSDFNRHIHSSNSNINFEVAFLIISVPIFLFLMRSINKRVAADPAKDEIWVRHWALISTIFITGIAMVVDLIILLTSYLGGEEIGTAFILKSLTVLLISAGVCGYVLAELKGYWNTFPLRKRLVCIVIKILVVLAIVAGFSVISTPWNARLERFDEQKINNLSSIESDIRYYFANKKILPATLSEVNTQEFFRHQIMIDKQTKKPYGYEVTDKKSFKLCAVFNKKSSGIVSEIVSPTKAEYNWEHDAGEFCFERTIDSVNGPAFYPDDINAINAMPVPAPVRIN